MKIKRNLLASGVLLAAVGVGFGQAVITQQPQSQANVAGTTATFTVAATGTEPLAYQWQKNWVDLLGCTNTNLCLTNVQNRDADWYRVIVTNVGGAVTSDWAYLTVILGPPVVYQTTNNTPSVSVGASVSMQASASGSLLTCQWFFGSFALPGKIGLWLNLTNVQTTDTGFYTFVATNLAGSSTSSPVRLDVDPTFTKIMTGAIVTDSKHWQGQAWGEYDNDGDLDVLILSCDGYFNPMYLNNGDGTFTRTIVPSLQGYTGTAHTWWFCCDD